ncbi:hypothetical protein RFI_06700 [Reticulomyxa filosa]|uniref:PPM-type phosphatase domain-containing protein n=1 Tax=Reticulomyxa filosa TaxID=46433 RepID=X6NWT1_RETFI|nr:hypothetical protein RFI_06700 [Reticulomyxa filosa]|eukprot:ETO30421.1 hypothetical protein RFI_06700 [Reticulomyxa filosa]
MFGCAVFDGHGGDVAAKFCTQELPALVAQRIAMDPRNPCRKEIESSPLRSPITAATTATTTTSIPLMSSDRSNQNVAVVNTSLNTTSTSATAAAATMPTLTMPTLPWDSHVELAEWDYICDALVQGFLQCEEQFNQTASQIHCSAGAAGVLVLLNGNDLYVANVGDSRAVLCRSEFGKAQCHRLTQIHKYTKFECEFERVQKAGANFSCDGYVNGQIEVTRSIGDFQQNSNNGCTEKIKGLTAFPHVSKVTLTECDEFLIVATDGLWDALKEETAVSCCRRVLRRNPNCSEAAHFLIKNAQIHSTNLQTNDNVSVVVIGFARPDEKGRWPLDLHLSTIDPCPN